MTFAKKVTVMLLVWLTTVTAASARRRDPLTEAETDQLREAALEPGKRLKLYIKFTDARLTAIEILRADPKEAAGRGRRVHDLLEDFEALLDEINSNLDMYQGRPLTKDDRKEFRKGLKEVIEACDKWDARLKSLKAAESDPQSKKEAEDYHYVLQDTQESLESTASLAREYIEETPIVEKDKKK